MVRGTLRIYLGAAPGVGKTYKMLEEGQRRARRGTDVVIGYIETHGRPRTTELVEGLEVVPRRSLEHRGTVLGEMDVEAILHRAPEVVLVDELAHTNVPGSTHAKRWQDVEDIVAAGITVITTVNIQHLESLNDVTASITGIRQRETVPDVVVRAADQIELADMSPQALRRRMVHGNIYAADKVDAALSNYFREGNLTALRELSLLWLADRVDEGMERYRDAHDIDSIWATRERIIVPVTGGPESVTLMRRAARLADRGVGGEWRALLVTEQDGLTGVSPDRIAELRAKTEELGGTFHAVMGDDIARAILDYARAENASQIIVGASRRGRFSALLRSGIGERVIADSGDIDVHVVTHDFAHDRRRANLQRQTLDRRRRAFSYAFALLVPAAVSLLLWWTEDFHELATEAMVLMVVVVISGLLGGLLPAAIAAASSALFLNYLFTPPRLTWTIAAPEDALAIVLFLFVGVAVASVVDYAARRAAAAREARSEADALTVLAHQLLHSEGDLDGLLASACELFSATGARITHRGDDGESEVVAQHTSGLPSPESVEVTADLGDEFVLTLTTEHPRASEQGLLNAYAAYAKVMTERRQATQAKIERLRLTEADRTRTALLAAVSHDLRSPLAVVRAATESLQNADLQWSDADRQELLDTIGDGTATLTTLVENLLDMSRIHTGAVTPQLAGVDVAVSVQEAIADLDGAERITVDVEPGVVAQADPGLLDRVLANICANALTYTPIESTIRVDAATSPDRVTVRICDRGPGVADLDALFVPFQRLGDVPQQDGVGLGLAVARGFMESMGGDLNAEETPGGGMTFVLTLLAPTHHREPDGNTAPSS